MDGGTAGERLERAPHGGHVRLDRLARPLGADALVLRRRELERVGGGEHGVVAARLDPRGEAELVEKRGHLVGRRFDQVDEVRLALAERARPRQRLREAVDRRQRRAQVVARERDEPCKALTRHRRLRFISK